MRVPNQHRLPLLIVVAAAVVFSWATALLAQAGEETSTTIGSAEAVGPEATSEMPSEVTWYAEEKGVPLESAQSMLELEGRLVEFATAVRSAPGYAGFRVATAGDVVTAQLAMTRGTRVAIPADLPVTVVNARVAESDVDTFTAAIADDLLRAGVSDFVAITYDPFEDVVLVWRADDASAITDPEATSIEQMAEEILAEHFEGIHVRIERQPSLELAYGGLYESKPGGGVCTSGFGVTKLIGGVWTGGYFTAGHCYLPNSTGWTINHPSGIKTVTSYADAVMGGYKDRVVFVAAGASYWVRMTPNTTADMQSTAYHIVLGVSYCHYGAYSPKQACGVINQVNVPITVDGVTLFMSHTPAVECRDGDSGGPVWHWVSQTVARQPSGTIEAYRISDGTCYYLALDDQLSGSGWSLL